MDKYIYIQTWAYYSLLSIRKVYIHRSVIALSFRGYHVKVSQIESIYS